MIKPFQAFLVGFCTVIGSATYSGSDMPCHGKIPNLIKDICYRCMFPIRLGPVPLTMPGQRDNGDPSPPLLCTCPAPPPLFVRVGVGLSYWEPVRMAEVVRTPMCSPTLGGVKLGSLPITSGSNTKQLGEESTSSFYHMHWFSYPVLSWIGMAFSAAACAEPDTFDMLYMTELDPFWDEESAAFLLNPEAILFGNPLAVGACAADSVKAAVTKFGINKLFWCSGAQGIVYPLTGWQSQHTGGVDTSLNLVHRFTFRLHRQGLARDTSTRAAMCSPGIQMVLRKTQYKQQMVYPLPQAKTAYGFGAPSIRWGAGKEFPTKGEDFGYLIWRKRQCCAL